MEEDKHIIQVDMIHISTYVPNYFLTRFEFFFLLIKRRFKNDFLKKNCLQIRKTLTFDNEHKVKKFILILFGAYFEYTILNVVNHISPMAKFDRSTQFTNANVNSHWKIFTLIFLN